MTRFWKILGLVALIAVFAGCVYGFQATFGPTRLTASFLALRFVYVIVAVMCIGGTVILVAELVRKR